MTCNFCGGADLDHVHTSEGEVGRVRTVDRYFECRDCGAENIDINGEDWDLAIPPKDMSIVSDLLHDLRKAV